MSLETLKQELTKLQTKETTLWKLLKKKTNKINNQKVNHIRIAKKYIIITDSLKIFEVKGTKSA